LLNKRQGLLVQEFFAPAERKDIRVFVVGKRVVAAIELNPSGKDFRSNIHLKGHGRPITLNKEQENLAVRSSRALGLEISGTDIIMDADDSMKVIEVNYSPGFRGLETFTGVDIASHIIQYLHRTYGGAP
jgi:ribosomal protein S6--L-glutamate ligase